MAKQEFLRLPVVSAGAEYLVMGYLMRRNTLGERGCTRDWYGRHGGECGCTGHE